VRRQAMAPRPSMVSRNADATGGGGANIVPGTQRWLKPGGCRPCVRSNRRTGWLDHATEPGDHA
jgi:hypothetical protein